MSLNRIEILERALKRERAARKQAEKILEEKSSQLYTISQKLKDSNTTLNRLVKEQTSQLKGVFENIADAFVVIDMFGHALKMNDTAIQLFETDYREQNLNLNTLVHSSEKDRIVENYKKLLTDGILTNFTLKIKSKNNIEKLININCSVIYNENNQPIAVQGIARDITKEREIYTQVIESESRLTSLISNLDSGILLEDENQNIIITNKKLCNLFSMNQSPDVLIGKNCKHIAENKKNIFKYPDLFEERIQTLLKEKKECLGEEILTLDGRILKRDFIPITVDNNYKGNLWTYKDITLKRNYEKSLEAERQKYSSIITNMGIGLVEVDLEDRILTANNSFCEMSGYSETELKGKIANVLFTKSDDSKKLKQENSNRKTGQTNSYEIVSKNKKGEKRNWLISGAPNYNINGEIIGSIGMNLDITELKKLEHQKEKLLKKLEKSNQELEEYAHIVSHDLKSPLRSIYSLISWIKEDNKNTFDKASLENFNLIEVTLEKMEQLITDILKYSSIHGVTEKTDINLNNLVNELIDILYIPEHIEVKILKPLPILKADKIKMQQIFQNLISNATKFIDKEKGLIEIDYTDLNSHHQFSIKDNGIGIENQFYEKIFKIFKTLNKSKSSTGIGLSIVKKIVNLNEGEIWVDSKIGEGTTFYFTIKKS